MKKIYENVKIFFESKLLFKILCGIGIVVIAFLIFYAGVTVGLSKASFGKAWGENYERNFGFGPDRPLLGANDFPNANGAIGKIIKIELPTIIVQDKDNTEKVILIKSDTKIEEMRQAVTANDLKINDFIVVIGSPNNQGQIEAKFIRVMPFGAPIPPTSTMSTPTEQIPAPIK
jgi:hypothetical protein